jgi:hypothetical protein
MLPTERDREGLRHGCAQSHELESRAELQLSAISWQGGCLCGTRCPPTVSLDRRHHAIAMKDVERAPRDLPT